MQVNNLLYCDLCTTYIPAGEKNRVNYGNQDFHFTCYQGHLQRLFAQKRVLAGQDSYRESERPLSLYRLLGC
jgi:RNase P subunit RPR2